MAALTLPDTPTIRPLLPADSIPELTQLLHRAYAPLAAQGLRYMATHQSDDVTRQRVASGRCFVAVLDGAICGTILYRPADQTKGSPWYDRPDVASIGQFAVDPQLQSRGLGLRLMILAEAQCQADATPELALDTAEPASHLVGWYNRLGYRFIEHAQWGHTNYRSVIMSKTL